MEQAKIVYKWSLSQCKCSPPNKGGNFRLTINVNDRSAQVIRPQELLGIRSNEIDLGEGAKLRSK